MSTRFARWCVSAEATPKGFLTCIVSQAAQAHMLPSICTCHTNATFMHAAEQARMGKLSGVLWAEQLLLAESL